MSVVLLIDALCVFLLVTGCDRTPDPFTTANREVDSNYRLRVRTEVIEGCEYLATPSAYGYLNLCHKGNCTNAIHAYNYRLEGK